MYNKDERIEPLVGPPSAPPTESQTGQMSRQPAIPVAVTAEYVASLPERLVRIAAAGGGGLLLETSNDSGTYAHQLGAFRQNVEMVPGPSPLVRLFAELNEASRE